MKKRKFECKKCLNNCIVLANDYYLPKTCCYDFGYKPDWHEVVDSAENEQFGNSEQLPSNPRKLPDWVKVGELIYCGLTKHYAEITEIKGEVITIHVLDSIMSYSLDIYKILQMGYPARKEPFNDAEMKALVGKILTHKETGDLTLVTDFINHYDKDQDLHYATVYAFGDNYTDGDLMDDCTLDGKPCYKLEHLNEKGEWVE